MEEYKDKVALVTGGSRGIGRAIAIQLSKMNINVAINYAHNETEAREVQRIIRDYRVNSIIVRADVSNSSDVNRLMNEVENNLGTVSILINNAGISRQIPFEKLTEKDWNETIDTNLKSVFLMTQAAVTKMRKNKWGRIINIASTAAQTGGLVGPHYTASKAGIIGLTHSYARLLINDGITVNAIAPALIETDMVTKDMEASKDVIPMKRFGNVEEVAVVVEMIIKNAYMTGQTINVNGGLFMSS